ncbi:hypothetical protein RB653_011178 (mitochondrion) [Dictyostelium firmibasis]|uniref:NADH:quinone oxidoreductase/Mrp antiporter transmembrane domain-containing protein n=1 Tax=Dictyostelium firmibasis TaxID=79012 RepID=A0AAN7YT36_9MYCE
MMILFESSLNMIKYSVYIVPLILMIILSISIENASKKMNIILKSMKITIIVIGILIMIEESTYVKLNGHLIKTEIIELFEIILLGVTYVIITIFEKGVKEGTKTKITEEGIILMYSSIIGMLISMEAHNLITLFLSLEISSICFYILALNKNSRKVSIEGGLKYYIVGGIASTIILLGIVCIYKSTGSLMYTDIFITLMENGKVDNIAQMGLSLLVLGLIIKLGIAPFHGWLIDTYEGTGMLMTYFLTITQKIVTIIILINLYLMIIAYVTIQGLNQVLLIGIIVTLLVGTIGSLRQQKLIRFIAYSAIVNSALLIMFFVGNNTEELVSYSIYYLVNYIIGLTVLISIIMGLNKNREGNIELLGELKNIWLNNRVVGVCFIVVLLYLAGLPPFTNFISKIILILPYIIEGRLYITMIILFLTVGIMIYYVNIVKILLIDKKQQEERGGVQKLETYQMKSGGTIIIGGMLWIVFSQVYLDEIINIIKIIVAISN